MNRGFGDVQFDAEADALAAIDNMDGAEVMGRVLRVRRSVKEGRQQTIDHRKAVWEQETGEATETKQEPTKEE